MAFSYSNNVNASGSTFVDVRGDKIFYNDNSSAPRSNRAILDGLQYAGGASFDRNKTCMSNTRRVLLDEIWTRIMSIDEKTTAEIFWLTSVAGAGKTTVAHTVARRCEEEGLLSSSFFFSRDVSGRNAPTKLFSTIARDFADQNMDFGERVAEALDKRKSLVEASLSLHFAELILRPSRCLLLDKPVVIVIDALDEGYDLELLTILHDEVSKLPGTFRILLTSRITRDLEIFLSEKPHVFPLSIDIDDPSNLTDIAFYARHKLRQVAIWGYLDGNWPGSRPLDDFVLKAGGLFIWVLIVSEYLRISTDPDSKLKVLLSNQRSLNLSAEAKMDEMYSTILQGCTWDDEDFVQGYGLLMGAIIAAKTPLSTSALGSLHRHDISLPVRNYLRSLAPLLTNLDNDNTAVKVLHLSLKEFLTVRARSSPMSEKLFLREEEHSRRLGILCLMVMSEDLNKYGSASGYLANPSELTGVPDIDENVISEGLLYSCNFWMDHVVEMEMLGPRLAVELHRFLGNHIVRWVEVVTSKGRFQDLARLRRWLERTYPEDTILKGCIFNPGVIAAFYDVSILLSETGRREEAYLAILEAHELHRQLVIDDPAVYNADRARYLLTLSNCLSELGRREEALDQIRDAVELYRHLTKDQPAVFNDDLASSLNSLSHRLSDLGHREEALDAIREAVELYLLLVKDGPVVFNTDLALSLNNLSFRLSDLGHREEALDAIREAVELCRLMAKDQSAVFNTNLAGSLHNLSNRLSDLGHREEALDAIREAVELHRLLAKDRPAVFNAYLARSLNNLSFRLSDLGHREEAFDTIREAVELYRNLVKDRPAVFNADLAASLTTLSVQLSDLGHREEALDAIREAVELRRLLAKDRPAVFNTNLADSLNNLSFRLSDLGQREEALDAIREAVELRRLLAKDRPAVFNADLADSLNNLSLQLSDFGHREEALDAIREAVELCRLMAKDQPAVFNTNLAQSLNNLSKQLWDLGHQEEALDAIQEAVELYRNLVKDRPAVFNAALARSLNDLSVQLSREEALDAIREAVELYWNLVKDRPAVFNADLARSLYNLSLWLSDLGHREVALDAIREAVELRRLLAKDYPTVSNADLTNSLRNLPNLLSDLGRQQEALDVIREAVELYRELAHDRLPEYNGSLVYCLVSFSDILSHLGHGDDAPNTNLEVDVPRHQPGVKD